MSYQYLTFSPNPKEKWLNNTHLDKGYGWMVRGKLEHHVGSVLGIDPGVNFGITIIRNDDIFIMNGKLLTQKDQRIEYSRFSYMLTKYLINWYGIDDATFVLEGAAFNKQFGQVNLAEVRTGYYLAMRDYGEVKMASPMSARKVVFGGGKIQPMDVWPFLNHNSADSLSLALYGL